MQAFDPWPYVCVCFVLVVVLISGCVWGCLGVFFVGLLVLRTEVTYFEGGGGGVFKGKKLGKLVGLLSSSETFQRVDPLFIIGFA